MEDAVPPYRRALLAPIAVGVALLEWHKVLVITVGQKK